VTTRWLLVLLALSACAKRPTAGGVRLKQVNDAFESAGFKLDGFHAFDAGRFAAERCMNGPIDGVDTVVCEYGGADAVKLGHKAAEDWVAQATTGAVLTNGNTLLVVADRSRVDPNGKLIHKITQAYKKVR
jgi:hypothetical protein